MKVRFHHEAQRFASYKDENAATFDVEMGAVPRVGDHIEFPLWYFPYPCAVERVTWPLHDGIPADVVVTVSS